ncbi:MAG TPA: OB-fold nucleic acid binding domain-containing protein, partial [Kofleriaceae bacterium]|nr:OB-fold nucleic acid binding domain-containing protein [Kofleriaceae bacterium]
EPVHDIVPIENGTLADRTVIQWDKDDLEELGLFKVDLLGLGALHQLHRCFDLLKRHRGIALSMATIPADDSDTYDMICRADTVGVFQIESRAQMSMLPRLRPRYFYDLVVEVSIVRPGPITGGMVHPYLRRRNGEEPVVYPHECLRPVLEKTLGVPLFQEQVMKLAVVAADYTPGEADQLRRDMAAWRRSGRIEQHRQRLISRMEEKGIATEFAERVFEQIRGFGEYGFPESHAASFALIAYATSWMRCHYMAEFTCALLNAQPMGFYSAATIVGDAIRHGVEVRPIDVSASDWDCTLEPIDGEHFALRMGLRYVKGLGDAEWQRIRSVREAHPFSSVADFVLRTRLDEGTQSRLAEAGALGCFGTSRRDALWQVRGLVKTQHDSLRLPSRVRAPGFAELDELETVLWDYHTSSHSVRAHPLTPLREALRAQRLPDARGVAAMRDGARVRYAGIVICRQRPGTAGGVTFMTLEDETGFVNAIIWKAVFDRHAVLARTQAFLGITGRLQIDQGIVHLIADELWAPRLHATPASAPSHDFH